MKLCIFSSVIGRILDNGKPVKNQLITRSYNWQSVDYTEETFTDDNGIFTFENTFKWSLLWILIPHNPAILQFINIEYKGEKQQLWGYTKGNYAIDGEYEGKKIYLDCEMNNNAKTYPVSSCKNYKGIGKLVEKF